MFRLFLVYGNTCRVCGFILLVSLVPVYCIYFGDISSLVLDPQSSIFNPAYSAIFQRFSRNTVALHDILMLVNGEFNLPNC